MSVFAGTVQPEAHRALVHAKAADLLRSREKDPNAAPVMLLRAAPVWPGPPVLPVTVDDAPPVGVRVVGAGSVLAVLDALSGARDAEVTVVLTPCEETDLGPTLLAKVAGRKIHHLDLWEVICGEVGTRHIDPQLRAAGHAWLAEAVLGVPGLLGRLRGRPLRRSDLLERLAAIRLGFGADRSIDAATLLDWSLDEPGVVAFMRDPGPETAGICAHLAESIGPVARIVLGLARVGQSRDAIPLGLVLAELYGPRHAPEDLVKETRVRVEMRYLDNDPPEDAALRAYGEICVALTARWTEEPSRTGTATLMYERATEILAELRAGDIAAHSQLLTAGFNARAAEFATRITSALTHPGAAALAAAEEVLERLRAHRIARRHTERVEAAVCAMRLLRWLARPKPSISTVAGGITWHIREGGWVDRALRVIRNPTLPGSGSYGELFAAVRARRAELDAAYARKLAAWPGRDTRSLVLAETLLDRVARPLAETAAPLIVVIDGMSAADVSLIAEEIAATGAWTEVGHDAKGRTGALSVLPSSTRYSRPSLLSGRLRAGGQRDEDSGFAAFWGRRKAVVFHKDELRPAAGEEIAAAALAALTDTKTVVAAVLNSVDDALAADERLSKPLWDLSGIDHLDPLLRQAAEQGRPVVITSDHGHVREDGTGRRTHDGESARHRSPAEPAAEGELLFSGGRVLYPGGSVVLPYDESVRYGHRRAGYHGGASLAETVIPILAFVPVGVARPANWESFPKVADHQPEWWSRPQSTVTVAPPARRTAKKATPAPAEALFTPEALQAETLGRRVCATELYRAQAKNLRPPQHEETVAGILDALDAAGGRLPVKRVAERLNRSVFSAHGYIATLQRVFNLDGYQVIGRADDDQTIVLDRRLLVQQFLGGRR